MGGSGRKWSEEEEPWDISDLSSVFQVLLPFFKQVQEGIPRSAHGQSTISLHVVWVHFQFNCFPDESVHVLFFGERSFVSFSSINQDHIIKLYVLSNIINHEHVSIAFPIITRVALQVY